MKKILFLLPMLMLLFVLPMSAQNSKVTSGVVAYNNNDIDEAIDKLNQALSKPELIKEKLIPKAHYYLCQSYQRAMQDPGLATQYPDAMNKAYEHMTATRSTLQYAAGIDKKNFENGLALSEQVLFSGMFNKGILMYQQEQTKESLPYFEKSKELNKESHLPLMMLGYAHIATGDTAGAIEDWNSALAVHNKLLQSPNVSPDTLLASVYLSLANIHMIYSDDSNKALETIESGLKLYPKDPDLSKTELSIYQQDPDLLETALTKFNTAIAENPDDINVKVAYADLLSKAGKDDESIKLYEEILESDADNFYANLNLAANYINQAKDLSDQYEKSSNEDESERIYIEIKDRFTKAYPYMKQTQALQPDNMEWIRQMVQITGYLGMDEEMIEYHNLQKALMEGRE